MPLTRGSDRRSATALLSRSSPRVTTRQSRARLSDVRIWAAAALVLVAALIAGSLLGREGDTTLVMSASRDLAAGAPVADLQPVAVPRHLADRYLGAQESATGVLRWPVVAGELVPRAALTDVGQRPTRLVSVPVDPLHTPAGLAAGDVVDVWVTPRSDAGIPGSETSPTRVLGEVLVTSVVTEGVGFAGGWGVELAVPEDEVEQVVAAGRSGVLDLVTVPPASQQVTS